MRIVYETTVLTTEPSPGRHRYWQGRVLEENGEYYTQATWWANKGAVQESTPKRAEPQTRQGGYVVSADLVAISTLANEVMKLCRDKFYTEVPA